MITSEQDPDVVRWGLQLFDSDPYSNYAYSGVIPHNSVDYYQDHYFKDDHFNAGSSNEENHNFSAQRLQEELSQLSVAEPPSNLHPMEKTIVMKKKQVMDLPLHALVQEKSHTQEKIGRIHLN